MQIISSLNNETIPTVNFSGANFPFTHFNRLQSTFLKIDYPNKNVIVAATTSAGKTVCAELAILDCLIKNKKCIMLSPLKALTSQQYSNWTDKSHFLNSKKIEIITGDHKLNENKLQNLKEAELIVMTSEMLDTRTRFAQSENSAWINNIDLLIVDEAHLLKTNRGPALEVGLIRFCKLNPHARILLLSATMSNARQVGEWLETLNNKETIVLTSDWRPVSLGVHEINTIGFGALEHTLRLVQILTSESKNLPLYLTSKNSEDRYYAQVRLKSNPEHVKTLIFVHTKNDGTRLQDALEAIGIKSEFHNADLDKKDREKIEEAFKNNLNVIIATSTLAWGMNLPAKNVIILGDQRGEERVDSIDIAQMAGRAGRFGIYDSGDVFLINSKLENNFQVSSCLDERLRFHLIAEIYTKLVTNTQEAISWYKKSLAFHQNQASIETISNKIQNIINELINNKLVAENNQALQCTLLGKIARDLYLDPLDIAMWNQNFSKIQNIDWSRHPEALAWAMGHKISNPLNYVPGIIQSKNKLVKNSCQKLGIDSPLASLNSLSGLIYSKIYPKERYDKYEAASIATQIPSNLTQTILKDFGRATSAVKRIFQVNQWNRVSEIESLYARVVYGVEEHLVELVKIPGIGATIATQLYKAGIKNKEQLLLNKHQLSSIISRKASVTKILKVLEQANEENNIDFN